MLDASSRSTLQVAAEIELSRDEDSVTSVANLASRDGLIALAGINSSEADQKAGKNEHLRAFDIKFPKKKRAENVEQTTEKEDESASGSISLVGKSTLFKPATGPKPETYQRLLRLSPAQRTQSGSRRIGAIATGLASSSEIVIFDATKTPPQASDIITRISLAAEAADLDITVTAENDFSVAWCTDHDVYEQTINYNFSTKKADFMPRGPRKVHSIPPRMTAGAPRAKLRGLRFLTSQNLLLLGNLPAKVGADLSILHLYPTGPGMLQLHKILPNHVKQAIGLDVCMLDADKDGSRQVAVAVGGQDISISVYTINYLRHTDTFSTFREFTTLRDVHPLQMTSICFSQFHSPIRAQPPPPTETGSNEMAPTHSQAPLHPGPQYIKLASVSMGNTVVVETFALSPLEPEQRNSRYVLSHPADERWTRNLYVVLISFIVLVFAILLQSYLVTDENNALTKFVPAGARRFLGQPANVAQGMGKQMRDVSSSVHSNVQQVIPEAVPSATQRLRDLLHLHSSSDSADSKAIILRSGSSGTTGLSVDVVPDREEYLKQDTAARHWHEMEEHERQTWKDELIAAGEWTVAEGEAVLKGILFRSYAGLVGQVAGEAIREL